VVGVRIVAELIATNTNAATVQSKTQNSAVAAAGFPVTAAQFQTPTTKFVQPATAIPTANPTQSPTQYIKPGFIAAAVLLTLFGVLVILIGVFFYRRRNISAEEPVKEPIVDVFLQEPISDFGARGYEPQTTTVERDISAAKVDAIPTPTDVKPAAVDNRV
jgi:hypothetical protein